MRCSSSEAHLDAYVDGTLAPRERARIDEHVAACPACASLLEEFRVIDALLLTPRTLEPAPNFTFKVLADVRSMPAPRAHRTPALAVLGTYVVFAWGAIGAFLIFARASALATLATVEAWFAQVGIAANGIATAVGHVFGRQQSDFTAAMAGLLVLDVGAAGAVIGLYTLLRSRRSAGIAEVDPC